MIEFDTGGWRVVIDDLFTRNNIRRVAYALAQRMSLLVEMIAVTKKPLSALVQEIYAEYGEMHMAEYDWALTEESKKSIQKTILEDQLLPDFGLPIKKVSYLDGCKVYFENGWIIVRFSGTEPRVRVFAERDTIKNADKLVQIMADFVGLPFDA